MIYFGTRLSENISRREPEGYLLCLNVPVARTGTQEYLAEELGLPHASAPIPVYRPEEEVFSPACIASFEGMPVTDDHPSFSEGVTAENIRYLQKGHAHNVRRGEGEESDLLLADLIITDPDLIESILSGKREISCGYNYTLCEENGRYVQREIRGNHIAVVDAGRAGPRVSIRDHDHTAREDAGKPLPDPAKSGRASPPVRAAPAASWPLTSHDDYGSKERRTTLMKNPLVSHRALRGSITAKRMARMMAAMARDGETEELAEMISEIMDPDPTLAAGEALLPAAVQGSVTAAPVVAAAPVAAPAVAPAAPVAVAPVAPAPVVAAPAVQVPAPIPADSAVPVLPTAAPAIAAAPAPAISAAPAVAVAPAVPVSAAPAVPVAPVITEAVTEVLEPVATPSPSAESALDCGAEILSLLRQIVAHLTGAPAADEADPSQTQTAPDEDPAVEEMVEAVVEAVEAAAEPELPAADDPVEALVAEAVQEVVEGAAAGAAEAAAETLADPDGIPDPALVPDEESPEDLLSGVIDPTQADCTEPASRGSDALRGASLRTADAVRAAMAAFRPALRRMDPAARRKTVARIAANLRAQDRLRARRAAGTQDTYALLRGAQRKPQNSRVLGEKIMASRNANYRKN